VGLDLARRAVGDLAVDDPKRGQPGREQDGARVQGEAQHDARLALGNDGSDGRGCRHIH
jgi:hypothetical protein